MEEITIAPLVMTEQERRARLYAEIEGGDLVRFDRNQVVTMKDGAEHSTIWRLVLSTLRQRKAIPRRERPHRSQDGETVFRRAGGFHSLERAWAVEMLGWVGHDRESAQRWLYGWGAPSPDDPRYQKSLKRYRANLREAYVSLGRAKETRHRIGTERRLP